MSKRGRLAVGCGKMFEEVEVEVEVEAASWPVESISIASLPEGTCGGTTT